MHPCPWLLLAETQPANQGKLYLSSMAQLKLLVPSGLSGLQQPLQIVLPSALLQHRRSPEPFSIWRQSFLCCWCCLLNADLISSGNGLDLTEAEDIKKRWREYKEEPYKPDFHYPDNHDGVITHIHLEPDTLECEVKWALGSITTNKASGGDRIPAELFQILKDDAYFSKF